MLKYRHLSKKAVIEVQFNWIFVLIAGSLILLFSIAIVNWQRGLAETNLAKDVRNNLRTIITHSKLGTEESRENLIRTPNKKINFVCDETTSFFSIEKTGISESLATTVLFSPDYIKGRELVTYTMKWKAPFFIMNFLYMTGPEVRYILVREDATTEAKAKEFYELLPEKISKEILDISSDPSASTLDLEYKNNYKIRFVFFYSILPNPITKQLPSEFDKIKNQISAININSDEVTFYKYIKTTMDSRYFEKTKSYGFLETPSLIGAIFAEDAENYKCNMEKAFGKYNIMADLYIERNDIIKDDVDPADCPYYTTSNLQGIYDEANNGFESANIADISGYIAALILENKNAEENSCPLIY